MIIFLTTEEEFSELDTLVVYDLLLYHDDIEIITGDIGISKQNEMEEKDHLEMEARGVLADKIPNSLREKFFKSDSEFRKKQTGEAKFANAIDKMDALVHVLQYPLDWGPKGFDETNVRKWFQFAFKFSPTFTKYFEGIIRFLNDKEYLNK